MAKQGHGDRLRLLTWGSRARDRGGGSPRWGWPGTARAVSVHSALTQGVSAPLVFVSALPVSVVSVDAFWL